MDCTRCPNLCASRTQIVQPDLPEFGRTCRLLVIGEAPGADEDREGKGFVGRAGRTLHQILEEQGLRRGYDYGCANIVRCRPLGNRKPTHAEIESCLPFLAETILQARPQALLLVGAIPTGMICGGGSLAYRIHQLRQYRWNIMPEMAHRLLQPAFQEYRPKVFPIPHTSPLAWNRNAPDGRKWSEIGQEVIRDLGVFLSLAPS